MDKAVTVPRRWHRLPVKDVAEALSVDPKLGLDPREAKKKFRPPADPVADERGSESGIPPCRPSQSGMGLEDESIGASGHQDESRESTEESVIAGGLRITINPPRSSFF